MKIDAIRETFGLRLFSLREAAVAFGPGIRSDLSRLVLDGRLERVGRGQYRVSDPNKRTAIRRTRTIMLRQQALQAPYRIALDGPDAVAAWTGGRYTVEGPGDPVLHLAVDSRDVEAAHLWLARQGWQVGSPSSWPEGRGPKVILRRVSALKRSLLDGVPVITRSAVNRLLETPTYEGAKEWLLEG